MSCHGFGLLAPNRYEVDFSNEVLNIDFGQGAAKLSEVKVGGQKEIADLAGFETEEARTPGAALADFLSTSNFDL